MHLNGILTLDFCVISAVLDRLNYQDNWELAIFLKLVYRPLDNEEKKANDMKYHIFNRLAKDSCVHERSSLVAVVMNAT